MAGTVITGLIGCGYRKRRIRLLFEYPKYISFIACVLVLNGLIMIFAVFSEAAKLVLSGGKPPCQLTWLRMHPINMRQCR